MSRGHVKHAIVSVRIEPELNVTALNGTEPMVCGVLTIYSPTRVERVTVPLCSDQLCIMNFLSQCSPAKIIYFYTAKTRTDSK